MANNQQDITDLFRIAVRGDILILPRDFIAMTGDLKSALFLARCVALAQRSPDATFARSSKEWQEDLFFSRHEVDAARGKGFPVGKDYSAQGIKRRSDNALHRRF